jgi:hypothetical protein
LVQKNRFQGVQPRSSPFSFEHGDLLPESEHLGGGFAATAKEDSEGGDEGADEFEHEGTVVTRRNTPS